MIISIPLRTSSGLNAREHWRARAKRVRTERLATGLVLNRQTRPPIPCTVRLTRIAPSNGLDDDNLCGALKAVRDQVAEWLGVDDKDRASVRYVYAQRRGPWAVEIEFGEPMSEDLSAAWFTPLKAEHKTQSPNSGAQLGACIL